MPIHSIYVVNPTSLRVLFCKHYSDDVVQNPDQRAIFDSVMWRNVSRYFKFLAAGHCKTLACPVGPVRIVLMQVGELVALLNGTTDIDEVALGQALEVIEKLLEDSCYGTTDGKKSQALIEADLLSSEAFGKFSVVIDEMLSGGIIESLDVETLLRASKLKNL